MTKETLQAAIDGVKWFHTLQLPYYNGKGTPSGQPWGLLTTPGMVDYCSRGVATERFGVPMRLSKISVLDIGAWDGFFSFEAESRGALVTAIDPGQDCSNVDHSHNGFHVAAAAMASNIQLYAHSLTEHRDRMKDMHLNKYDISFYFGVLYHTEDPITQLRALYDVTAHYALIETAVLPNRITYPSSKLWAFMPGFNGDTTNKWYPTSDALVQALHDVGFKRVERIFRTPDRNRVTLKAFAYDL